MGSAAISAGGDAELARVAAAAKELKDYLIGVGGVALRGLVVERFIPQRALRRNEVTMTKIAAGLCLLFTSAAGTLVAEPAPAAAASGRVFELRTYTASPGKLDALNARFRSHTIALFKRHGMEVIGFWMPLDKEAGAGEKLVYMLAYPSRAAAEASWKAFKADPEWVKVKADSETGGVLPAKIESVFLAGTDYSPVH